MKPTTFFTLTSLLLSPLAAQEGAGEGPAEEAKGPATSTVEKGQLDFTLNFEGTLLPKAATTVLYQPEAWGGFTILEVLPHGTEVKKGERVITADTEDLEKSIVDQEAALAKMKLDLDQSAIGLERLRRDQQIAREKSERQLQRARDDHERFMEITVPIKKREAKQALDQSRRRLDSELEELKQLTAMYEEDELTEETEEIILTRQKNRVEDVRFSVEKQELATKRQLETLIPREVEDYAKAMESRERGFKDMLEDQKFAAKDATQAHERLKRQYQRAEEKLEGLKSDLEQAAFTAPVAGTVFYGLIEEDGSWNYSDAPKRLVRGGSVAAEKPLFSIVPADAPLQLLASVDAATAGRLAYEVKGSAMVGDSPALRTEVSSIKVSPAPRINGKYHVLVQLEPAPFLKPTLKMKVKLHGTTREEFLLVDKKAVRTNDYGSPEVELRSGEDEFEARSIDVALEGDSHLAVESGLKAGDVVKLP